MDPTRSQRTSSALGATFPEEGGSEEDGDDLIVSPDAILYPTRGSVKMYLGLAAESPSLRRSFFTTSRSSQPSPTRSGPHTRRSIRLWVSTLGACAAN